MSPSGTPTQSAVVPSDHQLVQAARVRAAVGRLSRRLRLTHADGNLSPSQREVLSTVARRGPVRLSELAALEGINPTMLSRIVGKLILAGLVERSRDPDDGRVAHLGVTTAGLELHATIRDERTDALLWAMDQLDDGARQALEAALPALEALADAVARWER